MNESGRPLSPHLSVYRWPITMTLSILHRMTGAALSVGLLVYAAWLMSAAGGEGTYLRFAGLLDSLPGRVLLVAWSAAFFFHLANGIRHLIWDTGRGLDIEAANRSAWFAVAATVLLTLCFWWLL